MRTRRCLTIVGAVFILSGGFCCLHSQIDTDAVFLRVQSAGVLPGDGKGIDLKLSCSRTVVHPGESVFFLFECTNTSDSLIVFDMALWLNRVGGVKERYLGPYTLPLAGRKRISKTQALIIPGDIEPGDYVVTLSAKKGYDVLDEESFRIRVEQTQSRDETVPPHLP